MFYCLPHRRRHRCDESFFLNTNYDENISNDIARNLSLRNTHLLADRCYYFVCRPNWAVINRQRVVCVFFFLFIWFHIKQQTLVQCVRLYNTDCSVFTGVTSKSKVKMKSMALLRPRAYVNDFIDMLFYLCNRPRNRFV